MPATKLRQNDDRVMMNDDNRLPERSDRKNSAPPVALFLDAAVPRT